MNDLYRFYSVHYLRANHQVNGFLYSCYMALENQKKYFFKIIRYLFDIAIKVVRVRGVARKRISSFILL